MNKASPMLRIGDILLILLLLLASVGITFATLNRPVGARAIVTVDGDVVAVVSVGETTRIEVHGPLGATVVESDPEGVRIVDSPCPHKLCVRMGTALNRGQTLLCVPNHVAIRIEGDASQGVDGVTG